MEEQQRRLILLRFMPIELCQSKPKPLLVFL